MTMKSIGMKFSLAAVLLAGVAVTTSAAYADDAPAAPAWGTISAYVALASDYRFRGISQDDKNPSPEASLNWSGPDGFYAGTWLAKTNWSSVATCPTCGASPTFEMDLYAGKHFDLDGTDLNIEAYYYSYPDANAAVLGTTKSASYYETIVALSHTFGPLSLTVTGANSPEWSLGGGTGWYVEGTAAYTLTDWLSVSGNLGHQWVEAAPSDYTHYDIGLTATWKSWTLDARYVGNDIKKADATFWIADPKNVQDGFVATLTFNIANILQ
ncbi:MAG: TorF family putative porin [Rhizomicrobium sp.]